MRLREVELFGIALQSAVEELGIKINLASLEWATFLERIKSREFDACNLAWVPPLESDPEQLWHSKWGARDKKSSNNSGVMDPKIDAMIEGIQAEIDRETRMALWASVCERLRASASVCAHLRASASVCKRLRASASGDC